MTNSRRLHRIAEVWLENCRTFWAYELLQRAIERNPERAWRIILLILDKAETESDLDDLGAGPLEDLLATHPDSFIARVEALAAGNPRFQRALGHVWGTKRIRPDIYQRIRSANAD